MRWFKWALLAGLFYVGYRTYKAHAAGFAWMNALKSSLPFGLGNSASVADTPTGPYLAPAGPAVPPSVL